jgi:hypothetical protein
MSDAAGIEDELWTVVEDFQRPIDPSGYEMLRKQIRDCVRRMEDERRTDGIDEAKENLRRLLELSSSAPIGNGVVNQASLVFSLHALCPIWPFC